MTRRLQLKLLGDDWIPYGGYEIPEDRIIELPEEDAAHYLRAAGTRKVEILGWVDSDDSDVDEADS